LILAKACFFYSIFFVLFYFANSIWAGTFIDNNNGTVTDKSTGLVWQKGDSYHDVKNGLNWYDALEYITLKNSEKFAGFDNWRLPSLNELNNLWQVSGTIKSKDDETLGLPNEFQGGGSYYIWTGEERGLDHAWYFGLGQKENYFNLKDLADLEQGVKMVRPSNTP
tara:strand:- start:339 stop:836 length:498 start_codon:yes stop_codon:yes gene_type:complete